MVQYDCPLTSLSINIPADPSLLRPLPLQFHDGLGFLVSHSLITNTFEFSLQLVNPKLTVPYWDFTIETTTATDLEYDPSQPNTRTELLSPSWFGSADLGDGLVRRRVVFGFSSPSALAKGYNRNRRQFLVNTYTTDELVPVYNVVRIALALYSTWYCSMAALGAVWYG